MNDKQVTKNINVIKPSSGNFLKVVLVVVGIIVVVGIVVAGAYLLNRQRSVVPVPGKAATTSQIQDNLDGPYLNTTLWQGIADFAGTIASFAGGNMNISVDSTAQMGGVETVNQMTGDFSAEVTVIANNNATATLSFDTGTTKVEVGRSETGVVSRNAGSNEVAIDLATGLFPVNLKMVRVGDVIQTFYDAGQGYLLLGNYLGATTGDGRLQLVVVKSGAAGANSQFDSFRADVNVSGAPTPVPGTAAACQLAFAVLDTTAVTPTTPTPTPTPVPGATVTPTPTPIPGATVTPTPTPVPGATVTPTPTPVPGATVTPTPVPGTPNACNGTCGSNDNCQNGMFCYNGLCRNPSCAEDTDCQCDSSTTTSTIPTPVTTLEKSGSGDGLWITLVIGIVMVAAGGLMLFAL